MLLSHTQPRCEDYDTHFRVGIGKNLITLDLYVAFDTILQDFTFYIIIILAPWATNTRLTGLVNTKKRKVSKERVGCEAFHTHLRGGLPGRDLCLLAIPVNTDQILS